ncbi:hypothetical protein [Salibacterium halotolerans]|uniref:Uncharacterized protein n=1 Tax=Salibacterium halotolerans TaxID=1884432 RepID=A0A1I5XZC4_9BACI|nr:hypothetical protein [Salibacterium halotolerans]SFQ37210.1 hypothetical protein SAMN05518683_13323 [Salibacterium halotolerans]
MKNIQWKLTADLSIRQGKWAVSLLAAIAALYIVMIVVTAQGNTPANFLTFFYEPAKLFMLVIAIFLSYSFLDTYIKLGVTRKQFLTANAVTAVLLAAGLTAAAGVLTGIQYAAMNGMGWSSMINTDAVMSLNIGMAAALPICFLNLIMHHFTGWMIGAGFHRYGWLPGIGFAAGGIALTAVSDMLWGFETIEALSMLLSLESGAVAGVLSITAAVLLIPLVFFLIWQMTKKAAVRS